MGTGDLRQRGFRGGFQGGRPGRRSDSVSLSRVLGEGEDPLTWSIPVFTSRTLRVRAHLVFVLFGVWELILSVPQARLGTTHVFMAMGALLVLVAAREVGRFFLSRRLAAPPDQIVLWPLGLLSVQGSGDASRPSLRAAGAGLVVNLALVPVLAGSLWMAGQGWDALLFNPLKPLGVVSGIGSHGVAILWWAHYLNLVLLGLNLLVPMLPLDGARVLEAILARRLKARSAAAVTCRVGMLTALVLFVAAMSADQTRLMGLAALGAGVCWIHLRRAEFLAGPAVTGEARPGRLETRAVERQHGGPPPLSAAPGPAPVLEARTGDDSVEVDRILAKVSASGLESLTSDERRTLSAATERRRKMPSANTNNR